MQLSKEQKYTIVTMVISFLVGIFASDSYLPSMPAITHYFSTSDHMVKLTISIYLLGLGMGPLFYGPLSDYFGRKKIILLGWAIALVGSFLCAISWDINSLLVGRFIQAFGVSAGMSVSRAMLTDAVQGEHLSRVGGYIGMIFSFIPAFAPIVGGYLQLHYGWRSNFIFLLGMTFLASLWMIFFAIETNKDTGSHSIHPKFVVKNYWSLISNKYFIIYPICTAVLFAAVMSYLTVSPFLFQNVLGLSPVQFGWLSIISGIGIFFGAFLNSKLSGRYRSLSLLKGSGVLMLVAVLLMWLLGMLGFLAVLPIVIPFFFFILGSQIAFANSFASGFSVLSSNKGIAAALFSTIQMMGSGLVSITVVLIHVNNQTSIAMLMSLFIAVFIGLLFLIRQPTVEK